MLTYKQAKKEDYHTILTIWEKSVRHTHFFLKEEDILFYRNVIPNHLDAVNLKLWFNEETVVGFSGSSDTNLDMLFLDDIAIGKGYGSFILNWLIKNEGIELIDVNSQNKTAESFYLAHGFEKVSEDEQDGFGKPYPITHLKLTNREAF